MPSIEDRYEPPGLHLIALEARLALEAILARLARSRYAEWPRGDGHPVMVLPGFGASDGFTTSLRRFLTELGYAAYPWKQGFNLGRRKGLRGKLLARIARLADRHGTNVSLVGWSLGGVFARGLAVTDPDHLRWVIALGSPFLCGPEATNARFGLNLVKRVTGRAAVTPPPVTLPEPQVPVTSIFTRTDGIVPWRACLQPTGPITENIQLIASHLGLLHNPLSRYALADRLNQAPGDWRPFLSRPPFGRWVTPYDGVA